MPKATLSRRAVFFNVLRCKAHHHEIGVATRAIKMMAAAKSDIAKSDIAKSDIAKSDIAKSDIAPKEGTLMNRC